MVRYATLFLLVVFTLTLHKLHQKLAKQNMKTIFTLQSASVHMISDGLNFKSDTLFTRKQEVNVLPCQQLRFIH